jgi:ABC-type glutathione transport system ATPase component
MATGSAPAIEVSNLRKRCGDVLAVDDISLRVSQGELLGFPGPNGAGRGHGRGLLRRGPARSRTALVDRIKPFVKEVNNMPYGFGRGGGYSRALTAHLKYL